MSRSIHLFLVCVFICAAASQRKDIPKKVIGLTRVISKSTYLPGKFVQNGRIMVKDAAGKRKRFFSLLASLFTKQPKEKAGCKTSGWTSKSHIKNDIEVIMYKNEQQKLVVFGFRGSESLKDWSDNSKLRLIPSTIEGTTFTTHEGFMKRYRHIASWFEREYKAVPKDYTIVLTGHSLGGAEATIAAVFAAGKLKRRPDAVDTYGSPKVGKSDFKNYYEKIVGCDLTVRMNAKGDLVTDLPFGSQYVHVCNEAKVDGKTGIDPLKAHELNGGYGRGIKNKYPDDDINYGCDKKLS